MAYTGLQFLNVLTFTRLYICCRTAVLQDFVLVHWLQKKTCGNYSAKGPCAIGVLHSKSLACIYKKNYPTLTSLFRQKAKQDTRLNTYSVSSSPSQINMELPFYCLWHGHCLLQEIGLFFICLPCEACPLHNHIYIDSVKQLIKELKISNPPCLLEQERAKHTPEPRYKSQHKTKIEGQWLKFPIAASKMTMKNRTISWTILLKRRPAKSVVANVHKCWVVGTKGVKLVAWWYPSRQTIIRHVQIAQRCQTWQAWWDFTGKLVLREVKRL